METSSWVKGMLNAQQVQHIQPYFIPHPFIDVLSFVYRPINYCPVCFLENPTWTIDYKSEYSSVRLSRLVEGIDWRLVQDGKLSQEEWHRVLNASGVPTTRYAYFLDW